MCFPGKGCEEEDLREGGKVREGKGWREWIWLFANKMGFPSSNPQASWWNKDPFLEGVGGRQGPDTAQDC